MALTAAGQEALFLRQMIDELELKSCAHSHSPTSSVSSHGTYTSGIRQRQLKMNALNKTNQRNTFTIIYTDNIAAKTIAEASGYSTRLKHIAVRLCFLQQIVGDNLVRIKYISTQNQAADLFTKALSPATFRSAAENLQSGSISPP